MHLRVCSHWQPSLEAPWQKNAPIQAWQHRHLRFQITCSVRVPHVFTAVSAVCMNPGRARAGSGKASVPARGRAAHVEAAAWTISQSLLYVRAATYFGASNKEQLFMFLKPDGTVATGLALTAFRGAPLKSKGGNRRTQTSRPAACPLPVSMCCQVRLLELVLRAPSTMCLGVGMC